MGDQCGDPHPESNSRSRCTPSRRRDGDRTAGPHHRDSAHSERTGPPGTARRDHRRELPSRNRLGSTGRKRIVVNRFWTPYRGARAFARRVQRQDRFVDHVSHRVGQEANGVHRRPCASYRGTRRHEAETVGQTPTSHTAHKRAKLSGESTPSPQRLMETA
jgi:hypothetical protein